MFRPKAGCPNGYGKSKNHNQESNNSVLSFSPTSVNRENSMENNGKIEHLLF